MQSSKITARLIPLSAASFLAYGVATMRPFGEAATGGDAIWGFNAGGAGEEVGA